MALKITRREACRTRDRVIVLFEVTASEESPIGDELLETPFALFSEVVVAGAEVPSSMVPIGHDACRAEGEWVLEFPFMQARCARARIFSMHGADSVQFMFCFGILKWESRFNHRVKARKMQRIVQAANSMASGAFAMQVLSFFESEETAVWRTSVEWRCLTTDEYEDGIVMPTVSCFSMKGRSIECRQHLFERQQGVIGADGQRVNRLLLSLELPKTVDSFALMARGPSAAIAPGFCVVDPRLSKELRSAYSELTKDACADDMAYRAWLNGHRASQDDLARQAEESQAWETKVSVIVPCYRSNTRFLEAAVRSVLRQSYGNWELLLLDASPEEGSVAEIAAAARDGRVRYIRLGSNAGIAGNTNEGIRRARGDYVAFLDHDDILEPDALFWYVKSIEETDPSPQLLYCDEDSFRKEGDFGQPSFKSDFNPDLLYSHNYVTHFLAVEKTLIDEIGLSPEDVSGAQDYDLTLRAVAAGARVRHVPNVLYHWRIHDTSTNGGHVENKPYAQEAGRLALERHFASLGIAGNVQETQEPFVYRMKYELPSPHPMVSVVIPSKDHAKLLECCIRSIVEKTTYDNYEIVVVENNSEDPKTPAEYEAICERFGERVRVIHWAGEFNYSKIVNYGVECVNGEYVLLLNNDIEVISPDFIEEMLGYLQREDVGVVGAKLYFRDGLTQHAGIVVGPFDAAIHLNQNLPPSRAGYLARAIRPSNFSAVTGACQMIRRTVYEQVGGYDERFAVGFNDVDFCLRVWQAGFRVVFTPYAELYHYEFVSRGREEVDPAKRERWKHEQALLMQIHPRYFIDGDPCSNPNLSKESLYCGL